jgi:hypothetical protein
MQPQVLTVRLKQEPSSVEDLILSIHIDQVLLLSIFYLFSCLHLKGLPDQGIPRVFYSNASAAVEY